MRLAIVPSRDRSKENRRKLAVLITLLAAVIVPEQPAKRTK